MKKRTILCLIAGFWLLGSLATAQKLMQPAKQGNEAAQVNTTVLSNQMMITIMARMKNHDLPEAKKIAFEMIDGHEQYIDTPTMEYRCFSSLMGKILYEVMGEQSGSKRTINWLEQPVADGFYFLAMIAYQEGNKAKALDYLQKSIQWDPVRSAFFAERGYMLLNQEGSKDLGMVAASYLKAADLADNIEDFAAAIRGMGFTYVEKGDMETGLACYILSLKFDPSSKAAKYEVEFIRRRNPLLVKNMDVNGAAAVLAERRIPTRINPVHVTVLWRLADQLVKNKQPRELKAVYRRILLIDPTNKEAKARLGSF